MYILDFKKNRERHILNNLIINQYLHNNLLQFPSNIPEVESEDVCPHSSALDTCDPVRQIDGGGHQKHIRLSSSLAGSQWVCEVKFLNAGLEVFA